MKEDTKILLIGMVQLAKILRNLCSTVANDATIKQHMYTENSANIEALYQLINQSVIK